MRAHARIIYAVVAVAAVLGAFWFFVGAPRRAEIAKLQDKTAQAEARRDAAVNATASAAQARAAYQRDYATTARLGKAVPPDTDVGSLVYQVESLARAHKIDFRAVKLTGGGAAPAAPAATTAKDQAAAGKDQAATATTTPAPPTIAQAPPGAAVGPAGLLTLPFTFTFDGGYLPTQRMLGAMDRLAYATRGGISVSGRLLTVDGFSLTASRFGFPKVKALVSATAYIVPADVGVTAGASPQGPAGAPNAGGASAAGAPAPTATAAATTGRNG
jgi:hypothetical protein